MHRTSSSTWVKGIADMFASQGVDTRRLFHAARLDMGLLERPEARVDVEKISELWELAVAWTGNPALGMDSELSARYVNFDLVGHVMLSSPDLRTGLGQLSRYLALISDCTTFEMLAEGRHSWLVLGHIGHTRRLPRQRQEYSLLAVLSMCRWLTRRPVQVLGAEFIFPQPVDLQPYCSTFGCPVRFDQPASRMLLCADDLDAPIPSRNPQMFDLHERLVHERLARLGNTRTSHRVHAEIVRRLPQGEPRREDIASELALTDRTLQRRLQAENTSYLQLLDAARSELARKYLAENRLSLGEVASLLGFGDQSNFFRACKRWFGLPPGQYRQQHGSHGHGVPLH